MQNSLTLILGGARSGKSSYAQNLAISHGGSVLYVATAAAGDQEMIERIAAHRAERPVDWITLEAQHQVGRSIAAYPEKTAVILLDCLTLLASNVLISLAEDTPEKEAHMAMNAELDALVEVYNDSQADWIIVTNEVGEGVVPSYPLGRIYRDILGRANQRLAQTASEVFLMVAGIPLKIK